MSYVPADINPKEISWHPCRSWWGGLVVSFLLLLAPAMLRAQGERWDFQSGITGSDEAFNPDIAIDKWGNVHTIGTSTASSGLYQIFYSSDVSGIFHAPVQATDTNNVYTDLGGPLNPSVLRLDPSGIIHIGFIARMPGATGEWGLFHADNSSGSEFKALSLITSSGPIQYDMAVDSAGIAHIVWVDRRDARITKFQYWNSVRPLERKEIASVECLATQQECRIGTPDIEIGRDGLIIAFRSDSGSVYVLRQTPGGFSPITKVAGTPAYDRELTLAGAADLRLRMAADPGGTIHLIYSHFADGPGHRMVQTSNATGQWLTSELNPAPFDTSASAFDIAYNGTDRVVAAWTVPPLAGRAGVPRVGFGEILQPGLSGSSWRVIPDLNGVLKSGGAIWKEGLHISAFGDRVVIASSHRTSQDANQQVGLIVRSSTRPIISYLFPDAAAAGMNVVVDAFAPARGHGSFGADGFHQSKVVMETVNAEDASQVVFGPSVVSWDGRLVSTMAFITPSAVAGPVPVQIRITDEVGSITSNVDTLFIVKPALKPGRLNNGGVIGSDALGLGRRSRRGVLVVDSLILGSGIFTVDTSDTDPRTPGNQGFLPIMILSRGRILIDSSATLTVSAMNDPARLVYGTGGPGGGGGGTGGFYTGGSGFTGGGPLVNSTSTGTAHGSGGVRSGRWNGGGSLNGTPGGAAFPGAAGGGGTGHPFGASGLFGRIAAHVPVRPNSGGYGGGSAGINPVGSNPSPIGGGGGGGPTLPGDDGRSQLGENVNNGGEAVGSPQLVPLAGGSGGGGGGYFSASSAFSNGGGGGGAIALFTYDTLEINGTLQADGANGINLFQLPNSSGGGGGAGGAILVGAQGLIKVGSTARLSANGGEGADGISGTDGGNGRAGLIRTDGKLSSPFIVASPGPSYQGPTTSTNASLVAGEGVKIRGNGAIGSEINVYIRAKGGSWDYSNPYVTTVGTDGVWSRELGPEAAADELYIAVMQRVRGPVHERYRFSPEWMMSPAGANIISRPVLVLGVDSINFSCVNFDSCGVFEISISNRASMADLIVTTGATQGPFTVTPPSVRIGANKLEKIQVRFCPNGTGNFQSQLQLRTNIPTADSIRTINVRGCGISGRLKVRDLTINLGEICPNECKDEVIRIYNPGEGVLTIRAIEGQPEEIGVVIKPGVSMPIILQSGDSIDVPVQLCLKRIDQSGVQVHLRANSFYPLDVILVKGTNIGPEFDMPDGINIGNVLVPSPGVETCREELRYIWNRSTKDRLKVKIMSVEGGDGKFTVVPAPPLDTSIAPGELLPLKVKFCVTDAGEYRAQLRIIFGGGSCEVDTVLHLWGAGILPAPKFVITEPRRDPLDDCRTIRFPVTSLMKSRSSRISIRNEGTATGTFGGVDGIEGNIADFSTDWAPGTTIDPATRIERSIKFTPKAIGFRSAKLVFRYDDGTPFDTICVEGISAEPGVRFCEVDAIDFGDVRVGDSSRKIFCLFNDGTAADTLLSMSNFAFQPFIWEKFITEEGVERALPIIIPPGGERLFVPFSFKPVSEGERIQVPSVRLASGREISFPLRGRGVVESIATSTSMIDFGCPPGGTDTRCFTLSNPGLYPLTIYNIWIQGAHRANFTIESLPDFPITVPVGESVSYCVRYVVGGLKAEDAKITIESSIPQSPPMYIDLKGDNCGIELEVDLWLPDTAVMVGDIFYLPVYAKLNLPVSVDNISYSIKLKYAADLLLPLDMSKENGLALDFNGTISTGLTATFVEQPSGELLVGDAIRHGEKEGVLVKIPFKVLLGPHYTTPITFKEVFTGINFTQNPSIFTALDCDTTSGGVVLLGPYALSQNIPNPFNPSTVIPYSIGKTAHVQLNLYDATGMIVRVLVNEVQPAGEHLFTLDASTLPSGVYTYELISGRFRKTMRLILLE